MPTNDTDADADDLPPSALFVRYVVDHRAPIARQRLLEITGLKERTLEDALDRLEVAGVVERHRDPDDPTKTIVR